MRISVPTSPCEEKSPERQPEAKKKKKGKGGVRGWGVGGLLLCVFTVHS